MKRKNQFVGRTKAANTKPGKSKRPDDREIKHRLRHIQKGIQRMADRNAEVLQSLRDAVGTLAEIQKGVDKVTRETDATLAKVAELERAIAGDADPAVTELLVQLRDQVTKLKASVAAADEKIPDPAEIPVPTPEPPPTPPIETAALKGRHNSPGRA